MTAPAKSWKFAFSATILIVLLSALANPTFADTKPKFLYVANEDFQTVSAYTVDSTTGVLTPIAGSPFAAAGFQVTSVAVDPAGKFAYVTARCISYGSCGNSLISAYAIDGTTGALTMVPGSPFTLGPSVHAVKVDPSGKFLYAVNECLMEFPCSGNGIVTAFSINRASGALTPVSGSPFPAGAAAFSITIDPSGKFAYVVNVCTVLNPGCTPPGSVSAYAIDGNTGALAPVLGSPFTAGQNAISLTVAPSGNIAYVVNDSGTISAYSIDSHTGALTPIAGSPFNAVGFSPVSLAVDPLGKFAYVGNSCGVGNCDTGGVGVYSINGATGALTAVPGSFIRAGTASNQVAVEPSGKFVYLSNECQLGVCSIGNVSAFAIDSVSGMLTPIVGSPFAAGARPVSLVIVGQSGNVPFDAFKAKVDIDQDRKTSFRVEGCFTLGASSNGINPLSESVELQVGTYSVTIPAGSFKAAGKHGFRYEGVINDVDLRIIIEHGDRDDHEDRDRRNRRDHDEKKTPEPANEYHFTAEGRGHILQGIKNPVTVGLIIGDDEGRTTVKADIDR